jgi:hypothetical protein
LLAPLDLRKPFVGEHGEDVGIGPFAFDEFVFEEVRLASHADPLQYTGGSQVAGVALSLQPMQAEDLESDP